MKRVIITLVLCVVVVGATMSQTLSNTEKRRINYRVLQVIEQYESLMLLNNEDKRTEFGFLFEDLNVKIFNDLIGRPTADNKISVKEYIDYLGKQKGVISKIRRVSKIATKYESDGWHTIMSFRKTLSYVDRYGILFSSNEYYNSDYTITMDIRYDSKKDCCYIAGIDGKANSEREPLPPHFFVINKTSEAVYKNLYNKSLQFNSAGQAFVTELNESAVSKLDMHIKNKLIAKTPNYEYLQLGYRIAGGRLKANFGITPMGAFDVKFPAPSGDKSVKSMAWEVSVDFGYTAPLGRSTALGLFVGAGMSKSNLSFQLNNMKYSCLVGGVAGSIGSQTNLRREYTLSASEDVAYTDIIVPLYIGLEHRLAKVVSLVWHFGVKAYFNMDTKVSQYRLTGTIEQGADVEMIDNTYSSFVLPSMYSVASPFTLPSISGVAGLGFSFNLYKRRLFADVKAYYEYGLDQVHKSTGTPVLDDRVGAYPLVPSGSTITNNVVTKSFVDCVSYRRQALWVGAGLTFKF